MEYEKAIDELLEPHLKKEEPQDTPKVLPICKHCDQPIKSYYMERTVWSRDQVSYSEKYGYDIQDSEVFDYTNDKPTYFCGECDKEIDEPILTK